MYDTWLHLHLPRLKAYREGGSSDVISVKVPGKTIGYASAAVVRNARFFVSEKGRQRCIREGVRNVHAWVIGELVPTDDHTTEGMRRAVYCPWKGSTFVDLDTKEPVHESKHVVMIREEVWYR